MLVERVAELSRRAHAESAELKKKLEALDGDRAIIGTGASMRAVLERAELVAKRKTSSVARSSAWSESSVSRRRRWRVGHEGHLFLRLDGFVLAFDEAGVSSTRTIAAP